MAFIIVGLRLNAPYVAEKCAVEGYLKICVNLDTHSAPLISASWSHKIRSSASYLFLTRLKFFNKFAAKVIFWDSPLRSTFTEKVEKCIWWVRWYEWQNNFIKLKNPNLEIQNLVKWRITWIGESLCHSTPFPTKNITPLFVADITSAVLWGSERAAACAEWVCAESLVIGAPAVAWPVSPHIKELAYNFVSSFKLWTRAGEGLCQNRQHSNLLNQLTV